MTPAETPWYDESGRPIDRLSKAFGSSLNRELGDMELLTLDLLEAYDARGKRIKELEKEIGEARSKAFEEIVAEAMELKRHIEVNYSTSLKQKTKEEKDGREDYETRT